MHILEENLRKETSEHFGLLELMLDADKMEFHILDLSQV